MSSPEPMPTARFLPQLPRAAVAPYTPPESVAPREFVASAHGRRTELSSHCVATLTDILAGLNAECEACSTQSHYVSKIRSACLGLGLKALKAQLSKRGLRCTTLSDLAARATSVNDGAVDRAVSTATLPAAPDEIKVEPMNRGACVLQ